MRSDETHAQFSHRVVRDVRIYGISENIEIIIAQLLEVMPEVVTVGIAASKIVLGKHKDIESKSISEILTIMSCIPGPGKRNVVNHNNTGAIHYLYKSNRYSPNVRYTSKDDDNKARRSSKSNEIGRSNTKPLKQYKCNKCGINASHDTASHKECSYCLGFLIGFIRITMVCIGFVHVRIESNPIFLIRSEHAQTQCKP